MSKKYVNYCYCRLKKGNSQFFHKSEILHPLLQRLTSVRAVNRDRVLSVAKVLIDQEIIHEKSKEFQKYLKKKTPMKDVNIMIIIYHIVWLFILKLIFIIRYIVNTIKKVFFKMLKEC